MVQAAKVGAGREGYARFVAANPRWLGFAFLLTFVSSVGQSFFVGLFVGPFGIAFDLSHSDWAALYALATTAAAALLIVVGRQIDHVDLRLFCCATLVGLGIAAALVASSQSVVGLGLALFLLRLCGQGLCFHIASTCMARWFIANRGKALSIAALGMPLGEAVLPALVLALREEWGWRACWWLATATVLAGVLPTVLALLWHGGRTPRTAVAASHAATAGSVSLEATPSWTRAQVLRDRAFWLLLPAFICGPAFLTALAIGQLTIAEDLGWGAVGLSLAWPAFALTKVAMSLPGGAIIDRFGAAWPTFASYPLLVLGFLIAVMVPGPAGAIAVMAVFGCHVGIAMTGFSALWAERYGTAHLGAIKAVCNAIAVFASACGPLLFSVPFDLGIDVRTILTAFAVFTAIATVALYFGLTAASDAGRRAQSLRSGQAPGERLPIAPD